MEPDSRAKNSKVTSTNKRVKAKTTKSFGTSVKKAKGSKTVRVGDKNTTSAKREKPLENPANKRVAASMQGERNSQDLYYNTLKLGRGFTRNEVGILQLRKKSRKPVI